MSRITQRISLIFSAGCAGGLTNSIVVWLCGLYGITTMFGVAITPQLSAAWLYPRIIWGGIWGILFLFPLMERRCIARGILYSLGPTLVQLFVVFPIKAKKGMLGLDLGVLTPLFVIVFNAVWGITASFWLRWVGR